MYWISVLLLFEFCSKFNFNWFLIMVCAQQLVVQHLSHSSNVGGFVVQLDGVVEGEETL